MGHFRERQELLQRVAREQAFLYSFYCCKLSVELFCVPVPAQNFVIRTVVLLDESLVHSMWVVVFGCAFYVVQQSMVLRNYTVGLFLSIVW